MALQYFIFVVTALQTVTMVVSNEGIISNSPELISEIINTPDVYARTANGESIGQIQIPSGNPGVPPFIYHDSSDEQTYVAENVLGDGSDNMGRANLPPVDIQNDPAVNNDKNMLINKDVAEIQDAGQGYRGSVVVEPPELQSNIQDYSVNYQQSYIPQSEFEYEGIRGSVHVDTDQRGFVINPNGKVVHHQYQDPRGQGRAVVYSDENNDRSGELPMLTLTTGYNPYVQESVDSQQPQNGFVRFENVPAPVQKERDTYEVKYNGSPVSPVPGIEYNPWFIPEEQPTEKSTVERFQEQRYSQDNYFNPYQQYEVQETTTDPYAQETQQPPPRPPQQLNLGLGDTSHSGDSSQRVPWQTSQLNPYTAEREDNPSQSEGLPFRFDLRESKRPKDSGYRDPAEARIDGSAEVLIDGNQRQQDGNFHFRPVGVSRSNPSAPVKIESSKEGQYNPLDFYPTAAPLPDDFTGFQRYDVKGFDHHKQRDPIWDDETTTDVIDVRVSCDMEQNVMLIDVEFEGDFNGALYPKGYYKSDKCKVQAHGGRHHTIVIPLDLCGTEVMKTVSGSNFQGHVFYNNTLVVMNEAAWGILDMNDRAFTVSCLWTGSQAKTVDYNMNVPVMETNTHVAAGQIEIPNCWLRIVPGVDPFGGDARVLQLGETGTMVVSVKNYQEVFDIFVSKCYGHDGLGQSRIRLIDEDGCPASTKFVKPAVYDRSTRPGETHMYSHFKVFKFPDVDDVYIQCQCLVCYDRCYRPQCSNKNQGRKKREAPPSEEKKGEIEEVKIFQKFKVELPGPFEDKLYRDFQPSGNAQGQFVTYTPESCVPKEAFIAVLVSIMGILLLAITIAICLYVKLQRVTQLREKERAARIHPVHVPEFQRPVNPAFRPLKLLSQDLETTNENTSNERKKTSSGNDLSSAGSMEA